MSALFYITFKIKKQGSSSDKSSNAIVKVEKIHPDAELPDSENIAPFIVDVLLEDSSLWSTEKLSRLFEKLGELSSAIKEGSKEAFKEMKNTIQKELFKVINIDKKDDSLICEISPQKDISFETLLPKEPLNTTVFPVIVAYLRETKKPEKKKKAKKKPKSPFPSENEHSYDDLIDFASSKLLAYFESASRDLRFDMYITNYIAELVIQIAREGRIQKADEILTDFLKKIEVKEDGADNIGFINGKPHWDPYIVFMIGVLAHATAHLGRMGHKEIALKHLEKIKEIYHSIVNSKEIKPAYVAPTAAWIGTTEKILGKKGELLEFSKEIEGKMDEYEGKKNRAHVATAFAFAGLWEDALNLLSRSSVTWWYEIGDMLSLIEETKDLKLFEEFFKVIKSETFREDFSDYTYIKNRYAIANLNAGNPNKAWETVEPDTDIILSAILNYPSWNITSGGYIINTILNKVKEEEGKEGIAKLLGPVAEKLMREASENKDKIIQWLAIVRLWRKYDNVMEAEYNEFLNKVTEVIDSIELGNKIKLLACISTEHPLWEKIYENVEKDMVERGYGSLYSYDIFLQTVKNIPEAVERFVRARIDRIPETVERDYRSNHFQILSSGAAYAGHLNAAHIARMKVSKKWRYVPTAHIARAAFLMGNISAGIAALNEVPIDAEDDEIRCSVVWPFVYAFGTRIPLIAPIQP